MFLSFLEDWDYMGILPVSWNLAGVEGVLVLTSLTATDIFQNKSSTINSFYKHRLHEKDERPLNMFVIFALHIMGRNFAY